MTTFRKIMYYTAGMFALVSLMQLPFVFATSSIVGNKQSIPKALESANTYEKLGPLVVKDLSANTTDPETKKLLEEPGIQKAITDSITENDVRTSSDTIISGIYDWLEGKSPLPEVSIDLTQAKDRLVSNLAAFAADRSRDLPECTQAQLVTVDFTSDLLSIPCLPPGITPELAGQEFAKQATEKIEFLRNPVITTNTIIGDKDRAQIEEDAKVGPEIYSGLKDSKWVSLGFTAILLLLLVVARRDRRAGMKFVGLLFLIAGAVTGVFTLLLLLTKVPASAIEGTGELVGAIVIALSRQMIEIVRAFAFGYVAIGLLIKFYLHKTADIDPVGIDQPKTDA